MSQINEKIKDDFQLVLLLSCLGGHPVVGVARVILKLANTRQKRKLADYLGNPWVLYKG